ncbi:MAG TPA: indole-3-glycerol phosphate synthase TrpC [Thermoanaerobaculia bacterium]|nr:indole-3-glycerol phosphate synthase TrpC [Thermoanaerobaculia bacterium]
MIDELPDVLRTIVNSTRQRVARALAADGAGETVRLPAPTSAPNPFVAALRAEAGRAVIAEVKMGSPKLGSLARRVDPERQAELYAREGAAALSVVVEPDHFFGSYELLERCRRASGLPAIAKDFVVEPRQIDWAYQAGASAVLLIAALLDAEGLRARADQARRLGMAPLVELHGREDLAKLGRGGEWELVGVNNRDLRTFAVDLGHSIALLADLPAGALKVAESGIASGADVERLAAEGFDAFLVGESLLLAADPAAKLRELRGR